VDFGLTVFLTDLTARPADIARAAEERGFTSLWTAEHTHIPSSRRTPAPMGEPLPSYYQRTLDPFVALSFAAAATTRLRVGTGIALVAQRDPIITAKEVATLDLLSGGRFDFGIGFGWNAEELEDHGGTMASRRAVVRERLLTMQRLWTDEVAEFAGEHVELQPSWAWPKPVQQPWPPVLIGGSGGPVLFAHVVEYANGWIPIGGRGLTEQLPVLRSLWEDAGRDLADLRVVPFGTRPNPGKLEHYESLGITEVVLQVPGSGLDRILATLDDYAAYVAA
jgi:probable F420-dependent oxidoreductase